MINLNQHQEYTTKPILRLGFRPFFFASGVIAVISMLMWMIFYPALILVNNANPIDWYAHTSQLFVILSFVGFVLICTPMYFQARLDGQFG
ncbi:MAG: NnrS family protein [Proteobacteria bacterium]|nr:NnrS family protein [Pseudomonadota bacterium]MCH9750226.1 NnrS family protein [Pseudomonadota bacterium]